MDREMIEGKGKKRGGEKREQAGVTEVRAQGESRGKVEAHSPSKGAQQPAHWVQRIRPRACLFGDCADRSLALSPLALRMACAKGWALGCLWCFISKLVSLPLSLLQPSRLRLIRLFRGLNTREQQDEYCVSRVCTSRQVDKTGEPTS